MTRNSSLATTTIAAGSAVALFALVAKSGCANPECATPDYRVAECRVIAENEAARLDVDERIEIRFQDPSAIDDSTWDAKGRLRRLGNVVYARNAGLGPFALSLDTEPGDPVTVDLVLENVARSMTVTVSGPGSNLEIAVDATGLQRHVTLTLPPETTTWIRGSLECADRYRLALSADIQTNPDHFRRILEHLAAEAESVAGTEPLVGLVLMGDLTELSTAEQFEVIAELLAASSVPVAVTPGNHDTYDSLQPYYNDFFGPGNHSFTVCTTKMVLLDSGSGTLAESIEARVPELLERQGAEHLLLGMHHPPYPGLTGAGWSREDRAAALLVEAAIADVDLIVAGHKHALVDFPEIPVGDASLHEIVVGTGGAFQGAGRPRYGYVRATIAEGTLETCFVEVSPPGATMEPTAKVPGQLMACSD